MQAVSDPEVGRVAAGSALRVKIAWAAWLALITLTVVYAAAAGQLVVIQ